jgi:hypothetical protein
MNLLNPFSRFLRFVLPLLLLTTIHAQTLSTATVRGQVTDQNGAALAGTDIVIVNSAARFQARSPTTCPRPFPARSDCGQRPTAFLTSTISPLRRQPTDGVMFFFHAATRRNTKGRVEKEKG